ncbi:hypothetical protein ACI8B_340003 [Acinetobacter proteolyticus]|uniref:Uncharacterized protein n=1 Tax=Acinetobacter proteolyticus TaxID=1776741 RepID=A0A653K8I5_9GAMM|nr:hypothetical protein [Acinetobacter proteolyticus]VXA57261.1 hypothetical protein ACI8B_340003 [Acinetobacter proteolyticus]
MEIKNFEARRLISDNFEILPGDFSSSDEYPDKFIRISTIPGGGVSPVETFYMHIIDLNEVRYLIYLNEQLNEAEQAILQLDLENYITALVIPTEE